MRHITVSLPPSFLSLSFSPNAISCECWPPLHSPLQACEEPVTENYRVEQTIFAVLQKLSSNILIPEIGPVVQSASKNASVTIEVFQFLLLCGVVPSLD